MKAETRRSDRRINPLIWADVPDPDVIRVGEYYYMVSTTMHLCPGVPIMRSSDLVNWELISYVYDILEEDDYCNLAKGKHMYGKGSWAASLCYHEGTYYVCFACYNADKTYLYQTQNLEKGPWKRYELQGVYHDPSLLFDEGHVYLVYGNGTIRILELTEDVTGIKENGVNQILVSASKESNMLNAEGSHFYKINGSYYLFMIEWPKGYRRVEVCYRSKELLGKYEEKLILDDNFYYGNNGVAQGGIVDTPQGDWYGILFQDHGAVGRIPILVPVIWQDGWPMMGEGGLVPVNPKINYDKDVSYPIVMNDEFEYQENKLLLTWQWNHNPDSRFWSVTDRPGHLRLTCGSLAPNLPAAQNTLSQRTVGPEFIAETCLDTQGMKPGDYAGLAAFNKRYGMLGIKVTKEGEKLLILAFPNSEDNPVEQLSIPVSLEKIYLRIHFVFDQGDLKALKQVDRAYFSYSFDGEEWIQAEVSLQMIYTLEHFMGYRAALYNYATLETGGYADFDYFHCKILR